MTRSPTQTRRRIYEAAVAEFSAYGQDGTTIEKIAKRAGVNRERVYSHYGNKAVLFSYVVSTELAGIADAVPLAVSEPADIGDFAGKTFDYQQEHPHLARLVLWEGLADTGRSIDETARAALYARKAAAVTTAQSDGVVNDDLEPTALVFLIISLSSYWQAAPQLARMLLEDEPSNDADLARRRAAVVAAANRLTAPAPRSTRNKATRSRVGQHKQNAPKAPG